VVSIWSHCDELMRSLWRMEGIFLSFFIVLDLLDLPTPTVFVNCGSSNKREELADISAL
jgi:hypothetical protein